VGKEKGKTTPTREEKEQSGEREGEEKETEGTETEMQEHKNKTTQMTTAQTQTYGKKGTTRRQRKIGKRNKAGKHEKTTEAR